MYVYICILYIHILVCVCFFQTNQITLGIFLGALKNKYFGRGKNRFSLSTRSDSKTLSAMLTSSWNLRTSFAPQATCAVVRRFLERCEVWVSFSPWVQKGRNIQKGWKSHENRFAKQTLQISRRLRFILGGRPNPAARFGKCFSVTSNPKQATKKLSFASGIKASLFTSLFTFVRSSSSKSMSSATNS